RRSHEPRSRRRAERALRRAARARQARRRLRNQWPAAELAERRRKGARHPRVLVPGPGGWHRHGGGALRARQSGGEAAGHGGARGRTGPAFLQPQADGPPRLPVLRREPAVSFRFRVELHDVRDRRARAVRLPRAGGRAGRGAGRRPEHRRAHRRRGRAGVRARPGRVGHAAREAAQGFPARDARTGRAGDRHDRARSRGVRPGRPRHAVGRRAGRIRHHGGVELGRPEVDRAGGRRRMSAAERITSAEVIVTCPGRNFVTLRVTTESGATGVGDATLNGRELAVASYLEDHVVPCLLGRDAQRIEDTWQYLYRGAYWRRGPVTMTAIAAVDTALGDIKGKLAGLPVYQLLGGASREGVLVYGHASGGTVEETIESARAFVARGYRAVRLQSAVPGLASTYGVGGRG